MALDRGSRINSTLGNSEGGTGRLRRGGKVERLTQRGFLRKQNKFTIQSAVQKRRKENFEESGHRGRKERTNFSYQGGFVRMHSRRIPGKKKEGKDSV